MTHTEMEDALNNFDHRMLVVEQILPTLATKQDLWEGLADAKRHTDVKVEWLHDQIRVVAEVVALQTIKFDSLIDRVDSLTTRVDFLSDRVDFLAGRVDLLTDRVWSLERQVDAIGQRLDSLSGRVDSIGTSITSLIGRLERKGVI